MLAPQLPPINDLVAYAAVTMLFVAPLATLTNTIMVNKTARKIGDENKAQAEAATEHTQKVAVDTIIAAKKISDRNMIESKRIADNVNQVAVDTLKAAEKLATHTEEVKDLSAVSLHKLDDIHVMVNSNLSQALQESKDLRKEVAMLKEQLGNLTPEHMMEALECLKKTKKKKSGK